MTKPWKFFSWVNGKYLFGVQKKRQTCMCAPVSSLSVSSCLNSTVKALSQSTAAISMSVVLFIWMAPKNSVALKPEGKPRTVVSVIERQLSPWHAGTYWKRSLQRLFLTCAGTNAHDCVKSDALLHVFSEVSQEMLPVGLHLTKSRTFEIESRQMATVTTWSDTNENKPWFFFHTNFWLTDLKPAFMSISVLLV